ncbi:MAG: thiamine pyrophosphate-binding protein [Rhodospirillaceae bacterium]|nr:thiamine pyrophosphate-binding protein [Rhodospirillaceae bacterium]
MAATAADLSNSIGIVITTLGPGTASVVNGVAYARVDRAPLLVITDGWNAKQAHDSQQRYDQKALMAPITKAQTRLEGDDLPQEVERLIQLARAMPQGPVYIELTGEAAKRVVDDTFVSTKYAMTPPDAKAIASAREMIAAARKPVIIVGLEARGPGVGADIAALVEGLGCPVLSTYKAKGVVPDTLPQWVGLFTGAAAERDCVSAADLIIFVGFDPVELIGRPWVYTAPVLDLSAVQHPVHYVTPALGIYNDVASTMAALRGGHKRSLWTPEQIAGYRDAMRTRIVYQGEGAGLTPDAVVATAVKAAQGARATVDAGAHMISSMALWPARGANDIQISNGLSTMAFSLPAAIATALTDPSRAVLAFTGDGGLMMCAGELATAAQHGARICVVVFNDGALSLISLKQRSRQLPTEGVEWPKADFAAVAEGFGVKGFRARTAAEYEKALQAALAHKGPTLIDVDVDPSGYLAQITALRG